VPTLVSADATIARIRGIRSTTCFNTASPRSESDPHSTTTMSQRSPGGRWNTSPYPQKRVLTVNSRAAASTDPRYMVGSGLTPRSDCWILVSGGIGPHFRHVYLVHVLGITAVQAPGTGWLPPRPAWCGYP